MSSLAGTWLSDGISRRTMLVAGAGVTASATLPGLGGPSAIAPDRHSFVLALTQLTLPPTQTRGAGTTENVKFILAATQTGLFASSPIHLEMLAHHLDQAVGGDFAGKPVLVQFEALDQLDRASFSLVSSEPTAAEQSLMDRVAVTSNSSTQKPPTPREAWKFIKKLVLTAYYTSEEGASHELVYDLSPGDYKADIPVSEVPKAMSNDWLSAIMR